jgi:predicted nucleic acid-binding Zn ribbon protein
MTHQAWREASRKYYYNNREKILEKARLKNSGKLANIRIRGITIVFCVECGVEIKNAHWSQKYCSDKCRQKKSQNTVHEWQEDKLLWLEQKNIENNKWMYKNGIKKHKPTKNNNNIPYLKLCSECHMPFTTNTKSKKYCSQKCRSKHHNQTHRYLERICPSCNLTYKPRAEKQIYCSVKCGRYPKGLPEKICSSCSETYQPKSKRQVYCSKKCVNHEASRERRRYRKTWKNLALMFDMFLLNILIMFVLFD